MLLARLCSSRKPVSALASSVLVSSRRHFALSSRPSSTMADAAATVASPPVAARRPHAVKIGAVPGENRGTDSAKLITPFITKDDDLFWLRDDKRKSAEVLDHLRAENAYTASKTAALTAKDGPVEKLYAEFKSRLKETDAEVPYKHGPFAYYSRTEEGKSYPIHCRRSLAGRFRAADGSLRAAEGAEEVVLDENAVAAGNKMCDIHDSEVSPDHSVLAYSVDFSGWEEYTIRFKRLAQRAVGPSGAAQEAADVPAAADAGAAGAAEASWSEATESITKTSGDFAWGADGSTVYYTTLDAEHRPHRVWRHVLGTPQAADECILEEADERFWLGVGASMSEDYLLIESASKITAEVHAIPLTARAIAAATAAGASQAVKLDVAPVAAAESDDEEGGEDEDGDEDGGEDGEESGSDGEEEEEEEKEAAAAAAAAAAVPSGPRPPLPLLQLIAPRREGVLYEVEHARGSAADGSEDAFVILTNAGGAVNFKLCVAPTTTAAAAPAGADAAWVEVLSHSTDLYLTGVNTHARFWAISGRQGGYEGVWVADGQAVAAALASANAARAAAAGSAASTALQLTRLPAREDVYVLELGGGNAEYDTNSVRFRYSSPVCPTLTCEYAVYGSAADAAAGKAAAPVWPGAASAGAASGGASGGAGAAGGSPSASSSSIAILKQKEVPNVDPSLYRTTRVWATAGDGTRIPISIIYRPDAHKLREATAAAASGAGAAATEACPLAEPSPMLLYAYGSYGISIDPYFSAHALSLADRGVVYAIAHIRGGGEMGRAWYEPPNGGKLGCKWNTFRDYIACAEHLIASGWTVAGRIGAQGGSAGGLLMGVVTNERPDLWGAVLAEVPFVDVVTTMIDTSIPLTTTEFDEWGNPNERESFEYMRSYSPMDNVRAQRYPPMLLEAGLNDSRVAYWEPAKFAQRIRAAATEGSGAEVLLKVELDEGHAGAMDRYKAIHEKAYSWSWLLHHLKVPV